ncbi:hypothetical protein HN51_043693, partial [Arachis hypogaea]
MDIRILTGWQELWNHPRLLADNVDYPWTVTCIYNTLHHGPGRVAKKEKPKNQRGSKDWARTKGKGLGTKSNGLALSTLATGPDPDWKGESELALIFVPPAQQRNASYGESGSEEDGRTRLGDGTSGSRRPGSRGNRLVRREEGRDRTVGGAGDVEDGGVGLVAGAAFLFGRADDSEEHRVATRMVMGPRENPGSHNAMVRDELTMLEGLPQEIVAAGTYREPAANNGQPGTTQTSLCEQNGGSRADGLAGVDSGGAGSRQEDCGKEDRENVTSSIVAVAAVVAPAARVARAPSIALIAFAPFVAVVVRALSAVLLSYELLPAPLSSLLLLSSLEVCHHLFSSPLVQGKVVRGGFVELSKKLSLPLGSTLDRYEGLVLSVGRNGRSYVLILEAGPLADP